METGTKPRCTATTKAGNPCKGYALGAAYGDAADLCTGHARTAGLIVNKTRELTLDQALGGSGRVDVRETVRDAFVEIDPKQLKAYIQRAVLEGRDVRALTTLLDRVYGDSAHHVDEPHTFDQLALLTRDQRRVLLTQLEDEGRTGALYPTPSA